MKQIAEITGQPRLTPAQRYERRMALLVVCLPPAGFLAAVIGLWGHGVSALDLGLCLGLAAVTMLGITVGYHRLFTHRSFEAHPLVRWLLGIAGSMAAQGPVLFWAACHRRHHQHSDTEEDPHSPRAGFRKGLLRGLWHAHVGWMFSHQPECWGKYVPDLLRDDLAFRLNRTYLAWVLLGLAMPAILGGLAGGSWTAAAGGLCWGGFVRVFLAHHATWSINSICHAFGSAPYAAGDESKNNLLCALATFGEGWHNNHHAFPTSARHGLRWWQLDVTYVVIRWLAWAGLAWDVKTPSPRALRRKQASRLRRKGHLAGAAGLIRLKGANDASRNGRKPGSLSRGDCPAL
jgi:stearoyl-CoA desaturase (delta-9 desaturase)